MSGGVLVPDATYIRRNVSIKEVMIRVGVKQVDARNWTCWLAEHGQPRVTIDVRRNQTRCWKCHSRSLSPIDLVSSVLGLETGAAIEWLARKYGPVPRIPIAAARKKDRPLFQEAQATFDSVEEFVRSELWPQLSIGGRVLGMAILARIPRQEAVDPVLKTSYRALRRCAGLGSDTTIASGLRELQAANVCMVGLESVNSEGRGFAKRGTIIRWGKRHVEKAEIRSTEHVVSGVLNSTERVALHYRTATHNQLHSSSPSLGEAKKEPVPAPREICTEENIAEEIARLAQAKSMSAMKPMQEAEEQARRAVVQDQKNKLLAREAAGGFASVRPEPTPQLVAVEAGPPAEVATARAAEVPRVRRMRTPPVFEPLKVGRL